MAVVPPDVTNAISYFDPAGKFGGMKSACAVSGTPRANRAAAKIDFCNFMEASLPTLGVEPRSINANRPRHFSAAANHNLREIGKLPFSCLYHPLHFPQFT